MACRRMFAQSVVTSDDFLELSADARLLYYDLGMRADDDGFLTSAKRVLREICVPESALAELVDAGFLLRFDSGVLCIRDWGVNNQLRKDRYTPTRCTSQMERLMMVDGVYHEKKDVSGLPTGCQVVATDGLPTGCHLVAAGQDRADQESVDQGRRGQISADQQRAGEGACAPAADSAPASACASAAWGDDCASDEEDETPLTADDVLALSGEPEDMRFVAQRMVERYPTARIRRAVARSAGRPKPLVCAVRLLRDSPPGAG